jgi:hypothetical protein
VVLGVRHAQLAWPTLYHHPARCFSNFLQGFYEQQKASLILDLPSSFGGAWAWCAAVLASCGWRPMGRFRTRNLIRRWPLRRYQGCWACCARRRLPCRGPFHALHVIFKPQTLSYQVVPGVITSSHNSGREMHRQRASRSTLLDISGSYFYSLSNFAAL